jgi:3-isopropylmalate/(R)-2-methylmalate dehydratase large subunit
MNPQTLYDKLWASHLVRQEPDGTALIYIDRHLVHEVTSPQAFEGLKLAGRKPWRMDSVVATADHNTPTQHWEQGIQDPISRLQVETLDANIRKFGAKAYFPFLDKRQGIVHVIGPEQGATLPGMTVVCGDSHTSTHGAFGCLAHGIGTSEGRARARHAMPRAEENENHADRGQWSAGPWRNREGRSARR